jgi:hypothetical protein
LLFAVSLITYDWTPCSSVSTVQRGRNRIYLDFPATKPKRLSSLLCSVNDNVLSSLVPGMPLESLRGMNEKELVVSTVHPT